MKPYFITGTDTDCGKTYVTCQLLDYFKAKNQRTMAIKPVVSGCWEEQGILVNEDILQLQSHNGLIDQDISPWRFGPPISPHLAAKQMGQELSIQAITDFCFSKAFTELDYLLIEGAGGLMAPLNDQETWLNFLSLSKIPVILVVGIRLGCLNHALLTALALNKYQIHGVGWIANCLDKDMLALSENINTLQMKIEWPMLGIVPYGGSYCPQAHCPL